MPFGIMVVAADRSVLSVNPAARELLTEANGSWPEHGVTCCDLLGCRRAEGLAEHCISELAGGADHALPEIRLDLPPEDPTVAVWVTASKMGGDDARLLIHLRRGRVGDRRRRTKPHWMAEPQLQIDALGQTRVLGGETEIGGDWLLQRPGDLLRYLVCQRRRPVHVDEIVEALAPGAAADVGRNRVRYLMHALREKVEPGRPRRTRSNFIVSIGSTYALDSRVVLDIDQFEDWIATGLRGPSQTRSEREAASNALRKALELYRGDLFSDDPYSSWALHERERLRGLAYDALVWLVQHHRTQNDLGAVGDYLERGVTLWPLDTKVHRALITLYLEEGRNDAALNRFEILSERMRRELSEEPDFRLCDLTHE